MSLAVSKRPRWRVFAQRKPLLTSDDQRSITRTTTRTRTIGRNWKMEGDGREITDKPKTEERCIPLDKDGAPGRRDADPPHRSLRFDTDDFLICKRLID